MNEKEKELGVAVVDRFNAILASFPQQPSEECGLRMWMRFRDRMMARELVVIANGVSPEFRAKLDLFCHAEHYNCAKPKPGGPERGVDG